MKSGGQIVAVIPARGGSKRIPRKNLVPLAGVPLIVHTIRAALGATRLDRVVVSTDDADIARVSRENGAEVIYPRPPELCTDTAGTLDVLRHAITQLDPGGRRIGIVVLLQSSSPFRTGAMIDAAVLRMEATGADTVAAVRGVVEHPFYLWRQKGDLLEPFYSRKRQGTPRSRLPPYCIETGSLVVVKREVLMRRGLYGRRVVPIPIDGASCEDIDEPLDLEWAEFLLAHGLAALPEVRSARTATAPRS